MAKKVGISVSEHFRIDEKWLAKKGVFDATLDVDAPLFVDPFLLAGSRHKEFSECGFETYESHFSGIYSLLRASQNIGDKAWKGAFQKFKFSEAMKAEQTSRGHYVVIDVGKMGRKWDRLRDIERSNPKFGKLRKLHLIDGSLRDSASKLW